MGCSSKWRGRFVFVILMVLSSGAMMVGCGGPITAGTDVDDPNSMDDSGNQAPVAKAGPNMSATGGQRVTVDGGESFDPDGDALTFAWTASGSSHNTRFSDSTAASPTVELPSVEAETTIRLTLTVSDGALTAEDDLEILVSPFVTPASLILEPVPGPNVTATSGTVVVLDGSRSSIGDPEGTRIEWRQMTGARLTVDDANELIASFFAPNVAVTTEYRFLLVLTQDGRTASAPLTVTVLPLDFAPAATPPGPAAIPAPPAGGGGGGSSGGGGGGGAPPASPPPTDNCPNDPNKLEPGICGCGVVDDPTDTDSDGSADCVDGCPADPAKIAPGACGCGVADTDSDSDGTADCNDACPADPTKIAPLFCGCGQPETDTDADGSPDCVDGCPNDPNQTDVALCGQAPLASEHSDWDLYMLRLVNRARVDPTGEPARIGSSVTDNRPTVQPLAYAVLIGDAATNHNDWMHESLGLIASPDAPDSFTHYETVDGTSGGAPATGTPGFTGARISDRFNAVGYSWNAAGENIFARWGSSTITVNQGLIDANHRGWWESAGHRNNMLNGGYSAFGHRAETRAVSGPIGNLPGFVNFLHFATQNFARPSGGHHHAFGVLFDDLDASGGWNPRDDTDPLREGLRDVPFTVFEAGTATQVATGETLDNGAFTVLVADGSYDIVFMDAAMPGGVFTIGGVIVAGSNVNTGDHDPI